MLAVDMTVRPMPWGEAYRIPRMTADEAEATIAAELREQRRQAQAEEEARHEHCGAFHHGSCAADTFMRAEIARLKAELSQAEQDRDHWYMAAHHNDILLQTFAHRRAGLADEIRRQDAEAQHPTTTVHAA
ncbi:hypothetical protein [Microbacterium panaciterrae]|uniref:Uncharacterized protein n=1 Tax=Microbacterium panaciterrae TaxID=985759 RepID=A0ABP8PCN7_9MICO